MHSLDAFVARNVADNQETYRTKARTIARNNCPPGIVLCDMDGKEVMKYAQS